MQQVIEQDRHIRVMGQPITELPTDLYIPPDALEVILETFEGPLDLLLYLIKRQNLDILDIPVAHITEQYMAYVELMKATHLELAAEYLVMAAMLAEIKSRMLLPPSPLAEEDEADPRAELVRRLQEYERFKQAAHELDELPRYDRDIFPLQLDFAKTAIEKPLPQVNLQDLLNSFKEVLARAALHEHHHVAQEPLTVRQRMTDILACLNQEKYANFEQLFHAREGKRGVVVTFIAVLELVKQVLIELVQNEPFSPIYIKVIA